MPMLANLPAWLLPVRIALLLTSIAVGPSDERRGPPRLHGMRWRTARLAAKIALIDPELGNEVRQVTERIVRLARMLEGELHRLPSLEERFEQVVQQVGDRPGEEAVDEEQFERLAERFGLLRVRQALQRLEAAHPDVLTDEQ
jgi:hypothetical protein